MDNALIMYVSASVPQGLVLVSLPFFIYINDIIHNMKCGIELFANYISMSLMVWDENI